MRKRINFTHEREKTKKMIVASSSTSTWEWGLFPREREMIVSSYVVASTWDKGLFSIMKEKWIIFSFSLSLLATWWNIGLVFLDEKERWIASMWMKRKMVHYCFFWFHHEREREMDCFFFFFFHMRTRIACFAWKTW